MPLIDEYDALQDECEMENMEGQDNLDGSRDEATAGENCASQIEYEIQIVEEGNSLERKLDAILCLLDPSKSDDFFEKVSWFRK